MIRQALLNVDYEACAQIALVLFFLSFVAIIVRTATRSRSEMDYDAGLPLNDEPATNPAEGGGA